MGNPVSWIHRFCKKIEVTDRNTTEEDIILRWASTVHNNQKKEIRFPEWALVR